MSSVCNDRTPRQIARGGMDHYQATLCLSGKQSFATGRRHVAVQPGDLLLTDMAQASRFEMLGEPSTGISRAITLVLPRAVLGPLLASPDGAGGSFVSRDSKQGRLLGKQLLALCRQDGIGAEDSTAIVDSLAGIIADAVGSASDAKAATHRATRHMLTAAIKRAIDENLETPAMLTAEHLCARFALSRATLYRLLEPEGGLRRYIQDQKLRRAFTRLAVSASSGSRIIDLAVDFASDSTFVRAFRQRFGLTPGEVKRLAETAAGHGGSADVSDSLLLLKRLAST